MGCFESHLFLIMAAIILDLLIGDPKFFPHPVVLIGKIISFLDEKWNKGARLRAKGFLLLTVIIAMTTLITAAAVYLAGQLSFWAAAVLEVYFISSTIAIKGLQQAGEEVEKPLRDGDMETAREKLSYIVGRDTKHLPESEVVRGTVETVAENTVDGIIAPLFWALIGGAPLTMAYRAVNTLDSMVGYKNDRYENFGFASARFDDFLNWIPARITAICMWLAAWLRPGFNKTAAYRITLRDASKHPSPNSGWPEAMTAGLLGVQLGGVNTYKGVVSNRSKIGNTLTALKAEHIHQSIVIMHGGWGVFVLISMLLLWLI
ncbi:adenosylcobinamide-phosphate synthase CbiB [Halobacillus sp. Marseille-Q1614]|uniref:adenosylcobinamide-phosphate synthase CbiB n=1 Tax=Halobacillus sp. Marseille-Q1614 TaxID=2709134 RepID=UPI00156EF9C4|nr:adenosylcobinamide-phosphate synthase CbiB [Halobacillus sp. Marseille-Q1614]